MTITFDNFILHAKVLQPLAFYNVGDYITVAYCPSRSKYFYQDGTGNWTELPADSYQIVGRA